MGSELSPAGSGSTGRSILVLPSEPSFHPDLVQENQLEPVLSFSEPAPVCLSEFDRGPAHLERPVKASNVPVPPHFCHNFSSRRKITQKKIYMKNLLKEKNSLCFIRIKR